MAGPFFERLREYYLAVAAVLRGDAKAASIFPNTTDVGMAREQIYAEFLRLHAPAKCNTFLGGFLFGDTGEESRQLDVIVTTDTTPRFNFHNKAGQGKSFAPVEGSLGVASIKSQLNQAALLDALEGLASIPPTASLAGRVNTLLTIKNYDDWPFKVVYASDGIAGPTLLAHLDAYYTQNPGIPVGRRPNLIHVAGKYAIVRAVTGMSMWNANTKTSQDLVPGTFHMLTRDPDLQAIVWTLEGLQSRATASTHILYSYNSLINGVSGLP